MGSNRPEEWNRVGAGGGSGSGKGTKASDASIIDNNETVSRRGARRSGGLRRERRTAESGTGHRAHRGGGRGRNGGRRKGGRSDGGRKESRKNVMTIVDNGGEGRVLNRGGKEGRGSGWIRWKEADRLERFGMEAVACNAIVLGNGFVEGGGNVEEPRAAEL